MGVDAEVARSRGDIMARLRALEKEMERMRSDRRLEAAAIGAGGLRIQGGLLRIQDQAGDDMFRAGGTPGELFLRGDLLSPLVEAIVQELLVSPAGQALAAFVIGQRIHSATAAGLVSTGSTTFTTLAGGPVVSDVDITESGRALVFLSAHMIVNRSSGEGQREGIMGIDVSGATIINAQDDPNFLGTNRTGLSAATSVDQTSVQIRDTGVVFFGSLNPGTHTFTSVYRAFGSATPDPIFVGRNITVIAF